MKTIKEFLKLKINWWKVVILTVVVLLLLAGFLYLQLLNEPKPRIVSRIRADMEQMQTAAEVIYNKGGGYENVNCDYGDIKILCDDIERYAGKKPIIHVSNNLYCAYSRLSTGRYWCVDNTGISNAYNTEPCKTFTCE